MVRHTLIILQHLLQDFQSVSDLFETLRIKGLAIESEIHKRKHSGVLPISCDLDRQHTLNFGIGIPRECLPKLKNYF